MGVNVLSQDERLRRLNSANAIRVPRAADKRAIARGELRAQDILVELPAHWAGAKLEALLLAVPYVGAITAARMLRDLRLGGHRRLGSLTLRQRQEIVLYLNARRP